ncbi:hypothetical protein UFOVP5_17 [uncultured Caudovirales phage]|uniref:Lysis protein n=1 Tax=uncultured Caudovirales phage TaxID=2100421 RepID=A0A6J5KK63_9CAUD|nr:hypothetical protein UFOVP5_17 [uncultured Caudovirales phage]
MIAAALTRYWSHIGLAVALALLAVAWMGWRAEKALRQADRASYAQAQADAALIAKRALDAVEARYRRNAENADQTYTKELADARSSADRYIATHRVRVPSVAGNASGTVASASGGSAGVSDTVPASAVMVSDGDVQACTAAAAYAVKAHEWALTLAK